ncbi:MAG: hypothetical protein C4519_27835 [Desulfobacteraceae bacterium]|nr:MAG: hypothetical protein C4519_27835 [Desulfobacteraceae bacterium]
MTHDAMWYYHCLQELGPERANKINKDAVASMSAIEIKRILKLMGRVDQPVKTFDELREIIDSVYRLILPEFMKIHYGFPENNVFRGGFHECFAYEGVKKFAMADIYQCGIVVRIKGWLNGLGVKYEMVPEFTGCLMRDQGKCEIDFRFNLD